MEVAKQQRASLGSLSSLPPDSAEPDSRYRAVLDWVWSFSARPRTPEELAAQRAAKLERMRALLAALGHPEHSFPSVLVAGTKGKGSTVAMISASLSVARLRTGRYTSPHLVNWRERACVDGQPISTEAVLGLAGPIRKAVQALPPDVGALTRPTWPCGKRAPAGPSMPQTSLTRWYRRSPLSATTTPPRSARASTPSP